MNHIDMPIPGGKFPRWLFEQQRKLLARSPSSYDSYMLVFCGILDAANCDVVPGPYSGATEKAEVSITRQLERLWPMSKSGASQVLKRAHDDGLVQVTKTSMRHIAQVSLTPTKQKMVRPLRDVLDEFFAEQKRWLDTETASTALPPVPVVAEVKPDMAQMVTEVDAEIDYDQLAHALLRAAIDATEGDSDLKRRFWLLVDEHENLKRAYDQAMNELMRAREGGRNGTPVLSSEQASRLAKLRGN